MQDGTVPNKEIQTTATDTTSVVQPQATPEQLAQIEADKLALQSEYTRNRQSLIEATTLLAKNDPTYLNTIKDIKLQNTVVKQLYGFDTYEQAVAVLGNDFNAVKDGNEGVDDVQRLEREIKILKYNEQRNTVENELRNYKISHPQYFTNDGAEDKLRAELQYISGELPVAERIKRASAIAFTKPIDPTTAAYQALNSGAGGNATGGNAKINTSEAQLAEQQKQIEAGRKLLGLK